MINSARISVASSNGHDASANTHHDTAENSTQNITMRLIASRLRAVHEKMRVKDYAPLEQNNHDEQTLVHQRFDEISRAILFDYQDRCAKEQQMTTLLTAILEKLATPASVVTEAAIAPHFPIAEMVEKLETAFAKRQQEASQRMAAQIESLSRGLREATAAARSSVQFSKLESQLADIALKLNSATLPATNAAIEPSCDDVSLSINETSNLEDAATLAKSEEQDALSALLKNVPVHQAATEPKPFDASASARLIALARKNLSHFAKNKA